MDETRVKVEMEGGMWFELSGREEEEQLSRPDLRIVDRHGVQVPTFKLRFIYFDIKNPDMDENHQLVGVEEILSKRRTFAIFLEQCFDRHLGHGLTPEELGNCVKQFSVVVDHLIVHPIPPGNGNGNGNPPGDGIGNGYRRRRLSFDVKRRGVLGTRYHAREIEMQEEDVECRNRWNQMLEKGMSPANPSIVDGILGGYSWRRAMAKKDVCPICLEGFQCEEDATGMPCDHCFHTHCIARWLCRSHRCPMCRMPLPTLYVPSFASLIHIHNPLL